MNKIKYLLIFCLFISSATFADKYKISGRIIGYAAIPTTFNNSGTCSMAIKTIDNKYNGYYHRSSYASICDMALKFYQLNVPVVLWGNIDANNRYNVIVLEAYKDKVEWKNYPDGWK